MFNHNEISYEIPKIEDQSIGNNNIYVRNYDKLSSNWLYFNRISASAR